MVSTEPSATGRGSGDWNWGSAKGISDALWREPSGHLQQLTRGARVSRDSSRSSGTSAEASERQSDTQQEP